MKKMLILTPLLIAFVFVLAGCAPQRYLSEIFPDENLAQAVARTISGSSARGGGDITVTQAQLARINTLSAMNVRIEDLTGIEYLTNLDTLMISGNQISDLSPLAGLTRLRRLLLDSNQISDLAPLAELTSSLVELYLNNNQISNLAPLAELTNLRRLSLDNNQISNLAPLAELTSRLGFLFLDNNQINNLAPLAGLRGLATLHLNDNQISNLAPLAGLTRLMQLQLVNNQISNLAPLAELTDLLELHLDNNQVSNLAPLAELTNLLELHLDNNQVSDLRPLKTESFILLQIANQTIHLPNTTVIDATPLNLLNRNGIDIPLSGMGFEFENQSLVWLEKGEHTATWDSPIAGVPQGTFSGTIRQFVSPESPTIELRIGGSLDNVAGTTHRMFQGEQLEFIPTLINAGEEVENATFTWNLSIGAVAQTTVANGLVTIAPNQLLGNLRLNALTTFDGQSVSAYVHINVISFTINDIFPDANLARRVATIVGANVDSPIEMSRLTGITELFAEGAGIRDLTGIEHLTGLTHLWLSNNQVSNLAPLADLTNLESLSLNSNQINNLAPLADLTNLESLSLNGNQINNLAPLAGLTSLRALNLGSNQISNLEPLADLTNLRSLTLVSNQISDLRPLETGNFTSLQVASQTIYLPDTTILDATPLNLFNRNGTDIPLNGTGFEFENQSLLWLAKGEHTALWNAPIVGVSQGTFNGVVRQTVLPFTPAVELRLNGVGGNIAGETHQILRGEQLQFVPTLTDDGEEVPNATFIWHFSTSVTAQTTVANGLVTIAPTQPVGNLRLNASTTFNGQNVFAHVYLDVISFTVNDIFPDANLAQKVATALGVNVDSNIEISQLAGITSLIARDAEIRDLTGIDHLTGLMRLNLDDNLISNLAPLVGLTSLEWLGLNHNQISDLTALTGLTRLERLDLNHNQISDLAPLTGLTRLRTLQLDNNQISNLAPLASLTNLQWLTLNNNQISDLRPLGTRNFARLEMANQTIHLPTTTVSAETSLNLFNRNGVPIPLSSMEFEFANQNLAWQTPGDHTATWRASVAGSHATFDGTIHQTVLPLLLSLELRIDGLENNVAGETHQIIRGAQLKFVPTLTDYGKEVPNATFTWSFLTGAVAQTTVNNGLVTIAPNQPLGNLRLNVSTTFDGQNVSAYVYLDVIPLTINGIFPDANLAQRVANNLGINVDSSIEIAQLAGITSLSATHAEIHDLTGIEHLTRLTRLRLDNNWISNLAPLAGLRSLEWLDLNHNQISDLAPLAGLRSLGLLDLSHNQISNLAPLAGLTSLEWLSFSHNQISNLAPLARLTDLELLNLSHNQISNLEPLTSLTSLEWLNLNHNQISNLEPLADLRNLRFVMLNNNQISDLRPLGTRHFMQLELANQTIHLPTTTVSAETSLNLFNRNGVPLSLNGMEFEFANQNLVWQTPGDHTATWSAMVTGIIQGFRIVFNGTIHQTVLPSLLSLELSIDGLENNVTGETHQVLRGEQLKFVPTLTDDGKEVPNAAFSWSFPTGAVAQTTVDDGLVTIAPNQPLGNLRLNVSATFDGQDVSAYVYLDVISFTVNDVFPDANLAQKVATALGVNVDSDIEIAQLAGITSLSATHAEIRDLTGIEHLTGLTHLRLDDNWISNLAPLAGLTSLELLDLSHNQISNLAPLAGLTNLQWLTLNNNQISDLRPLGTGNFVLLELANQTIHLPTTTVSVKTPLNLYNRNGATIPLSGVGFEFANQNLVWQTPGDNTTTWRASVAGSHATFDGTIHQTVLPSLLSLELSIDGLENNVTGETHQIIRGEQLKIVPTLTDDGKEIPNATFSWSFSTGAVAQTTVANGLVTIAPNQPAGSLRLNVSATFDGQNVSAYVYLDVISLNDIFPDANLAQKVATALGVHVDSNTEVAQLAGITSLSATHAEIRDLTGIEHLTGLIRLNLDDNWISNLAPLAGLTSLEWLGLNHNQISNLEPLTDLTRLERLELSYNQINHIAPLEKLTSLEWLKLNYNQIVGLLPLASLTNLERLALNYNQINNLTPLAGLTNLERLELNHNQIDNLTPLRGLTSLEILQLANNQVGSILILAQLTSLRTLQLDNNQISNLAPLADLRNLRWVMLNNNQISDLRPLGTGNFVLLEVANQTIHLPNTIVSAETSLNLFNRNGTAIPLSGAGFEFANQNLVWQTPGDNTATWRASVANLGNFSGTIHQTVLPSLLSLELSIDGLENNVTGETHQIIRGEQLKIVPTLTDDGKAVPNVTFTWNLSVGAVAQTTVANGLVTIAPNQPVGNLRLNVSATFDGQNVSAYVYLDVISLTINDIFPDANLARKVEARLGVHIDSNIEIEQLAGITWLVATHAEIRDLTGIEHLTGLRSLWLQNNQISNIEPLAGLTNLLLLTLNNNQISDLRPLGTRIFSQLEVANQTIHLPNTIVGAGTPLNLFNRDGTAIPLNRSILEFANQNLVWKAPGNHTVVWGLHSHREFFGGMIHQTVLPGLRLQSEETEGPIQEQLPEESKDEIAVNKPQEKPTKPEDEEVKEAEAHPTTPDNHSKENEAEAEIPNKEAKLETSPKNYQPVQRR